MSSHGGPSSSSSTNGEGEGGGSAIVKPLLLPPLHSASEGPPAMTIEFLRVRLLSERSASKEARQQALLHEKRISELRQQIEAEACLRQKAEADVEQILETLKRQGLHSPISSADNAIFANESSATEEKGATTELQKMPGVGEEEENGEVETVSDASSPPIAIAKETQQKEDIVSPSDVEEGLAFPAAIAEEKQQSLGEEEVKETLAEAAQASAHDNISEQLEQNQDEIKRAPEEILSPNRRREEDDMTIDDPSLVSNPSSSTGSSASVGKPPSNAREEARRRVVIQDHHRHSFKSPSSNSESSGNQSNEDEEINQASLPFQAKLRNSYLPDMAAAYSRVRSSHPKPHLQRSSTVSTDRNGSYSHRTSFPSLADERSGRLGDILTALRLAKKQITSFDHVHGLEEQQQYSDGNLYYHVSSSPSGSRDSSSLSPSPSQSPLYGYPVEREAIPWNPYAAHASSTSPYYCNGSEAMLRLQRSASAIHHYYTMRPPQSHYRSPKKEVQLGNGIVLFTD